MRISVDCCAGRVSSPDQISIAGPAGRYAKARQRLVRPLLDSRANDISTALDCPEVAVRKHVV